MSRGIEQQVNGHRLMSLNSGLFALAPSYRSSSSSSANYLANAKLLWKIRPEDKVEGKFSSVDVLL